MRRTSEKQESRRLLFCRLFPFRLGTRSTRNSYNNRFTASPSRESFFRRKTRFSLLTTKDVTFSIYNFSLTINCFVGYVFRDVRIEISDFDFSKYCRRRHNVATRQIYFNEYFVYIYLYPFSSVDFSELLDTARLFTCFRTRRTLQNLLIYIFVPPNVTL